MPLLPLLAGTFFFLYGGDAYIVDTQINPNAKLSLNLFDSKCPVFISIRLCNAEAISTSLVELSPQFDTSHPGPLLFD